jgi:hypothetical protein
MKYVSILIRQRRKNLLSVHEFLHVLGFVHTQSRPDRDNFIQIKESMIQEDAIGQYTKCPSCETYGLPYDCHSIMHYEADAFSAGRTNALCK